MMYHDITKVNNVYITTNGIRIDNNSNWVVLHASAAVLKQLGALMDEAGGGGDQTLVIEFLDNFLSRETQLPAWLCKTPHSKNEAGDAKA